MIRLVVRALVYLLSASIGLLAATMLIDGFAVHVGGFVVAVVVFSLAQLVLGPFIFTVVRKNANALLGGVGLVSTFVALLLASMMSNGVHITSVSAWVLGSVVVWLVTALATLLVPLILVKAGWQAATAAHDERR
jgi:hypothetical protein